VSKDEQMRRFKQREKVSFKRFKITPEDWRNRKKWGAYESAVCDMVDRTSTSIAPWTLVEANNKYYARIKVLKTLTSALEAALEGIGGKGKEAAQVKRPRKSGTLFGVRQARWIRLELGDPLEQWPVGAAMSHAQARESAPIVLWSRFAASQAAMRSSGSRSSCRCTLRRGRSCAGPLGRFSPAVATTANSGCAPT
jgi:hypothetical protein